MSCWWLIVCLSICRICSFWRWFWVVGVLFLSGFLVFWLMMRRKRLGVGVVDWFFVGSWCCIMGVWGICLVFRCWNLLSLLIVFLIWIVRVVFFRIFIVWWCLRVLLVIMLRVLSFLVSKRFCFVFSLSLIWCLSFYGFLLVWLIFFWVFCFCFFFCLVFWVSLWI